MDNKLYGSKTRSENDQEYAQMMLKYIEGKYNKDFEIIEYIFPEEGFNTDHLQNFLLVKETQSGVITHVYSMQGEPYTYYDEYVSDLISFNNRQLVNCTSLNGLGSEKLYFYLRNEDLNSPDYSKENVSKVVLVVNITRKPETDTMEKLYEVYKNLFTLDYENVFLVVAFTEENKNFDDYVQYYRVLGKKDWVDYNGKVYATLSVTEADLTFNAFQNLCNS